MLEESRTLLTRLKENLNLMPDREQNLEIVFESVVKHLTSYQKIISPHLNDLEKVLQLESHQQKTLEDIELPEPIGTLKTLLNILTEDDLKMCENLLQSIQNTSEAQTVILQKA